MRRTLSKIVKILDGQPTGKRGQSMVEMALTSPLLILMILGLIEIGFFANDYLILLDAVRSASRVAVNLDPTSWTYGEAHNLNRMDCDTDQEIIPGQGPGSIYNMYPNEFLFDPNDPLQSVNAHYGQRADTDQWPAYAIARGSRGTHLMNATWSPQFHYAFSKQKDQAFGFFDSVACQVIVSMDPLHLQDYLKANGTDQTSATNAALPKSKDDIVVSAVSYAKMDYTGTTLGSVPCNGTACATTANTHGGYWITVTGRWPIESRYCNTGGPLASSKGDGRDPFDYKRKDFNTSWNNGNSAGTNDTSHDSPPPGPIYNGTSKDNQPWLASGSRVYEGPVSGEDQISNPARVPSDASNPDWRILDAQTRGADSQGVRGYVFTGNHQVWDGSNCFGSEFTEQDIEQRLNLNIDTSPGAPNLNQSSSNGGLVIVEVFWQYHPLFFGPLFQGFTANNKENDPVLHVWSFYPLPSVEPTPTPSH